MSEQQTDTTNDESALDAELEASIASVKAGNELVQTSTPEPTKPTSEVAPEKETELTEKADVDGEKPGDSQTAPEEQEFRIPNKGKFETDEAYEKRVELFDLVKRRKSTSDPAIKEQLSEQIKQAKNQLKSIGTSERLTNNVTEEKKTEEVDPVIAADQERLRQLGAATKEDVAEIIRSERIEQETKATLQKFVEEAPELKDSDIREVFFDFVDANYRWEGKTGAELRAILGMAYENMFRPAETISERLLKGASVAEKVNAMQFPGGSATKTSFSPEMQKSIDELKSTGMSEEKAIALLSE